MKFYDKIILMKKRIFFAIPLKTSLQKELASFQYQWLKAPIRWVKQKNLHITLLFIGQASDEEIGKMSEVIHEIAQHHKPFSLELNKIQLQPNASQPNLLWARAEDNSAFSHLYKDLEHTLREEKLYFPNTASPRKQIPHITLGRIQKWQWKQIEIEERPEIDQSFSLKIPVNEIALFESKLHRQGPEHFILETAKLNSR